MYIFYLYKLILVLNTAMSNKIFKLYVTVNMINGKVYGGKHFWYPDTKYIGSGYRLREAIKKYGKENFEVRWFKLKIKDPEHLNRLEIKLIRRLHYIFGKNKCYNIQKGGCGGYYTEYMDEDELTEVREKISKGLKNMYRDPVKYKNWKESLKKRNATHKKRIDNFGKTDKEKNKADFMRNNGYVIYTYKIIFPNGEEMIESMSLNNFVRKYNTDDFIFRKMRKNGVYTFKHITKLSKHPFPRGTNIEYISESRTFERYQ